MILQYFAWLLLVVPAAVLFWSWSPGHQLLKGLRAVAFTLILLSLAGLAVIRKGQEGTVIVVMDRSKSMPRNGQAEAREAIDLLEDAKPDHGRLGLVSFGLKAAVERFPGSPASGLFSASLDGDGSNLEEALERALDLIPQNASGRILVFSDGRWTGASPNLPAARAAARGIPIDFRHRDLSSAGDVAIQSWDAPSWVHVKEGFMTTLWVQSPAAQVVDYQLRRGPLKLAAGTRALIQGTNRFVFRDMASETGTLAYQFTISVPDDDPIPENNQARLLIGVKGAKPLLHISPAGDSSLGRMLQKGGVAVNSITPNQWAGSLEQLSSHSGVILENVLAADMGQKRLSTLRSWITESGGGLLVTGGKNSYGPGGYYGSVLEPVLPVSMELRQEHRKLSLAMVVAVDRSGSMGATVGTGQSKMDLANIAAAEVLNLLSPQDEFGLAAVDTEAHLVVPLQRAVEKQGLRGMVLSVAAQGGGIYVYRALVAAAQMLEPSNAGTRHVLLFADAADAEKPGSYKQLLEKFRAAEITVSVVGLGSASDKDAALLVDIAQGGNGQVYFTNNPLDLPRIFAQDTFVMARSTFIDQVTPTQWHGGMSRFSQTDFSAPPDLGGYNLCYLREGAESALITSDEYSAPVVASWFAGTGRVVCFTGEASGEYAGALGFWPQVGDFFAAMARWAAGSGGAELPGGSLVTQKVQDGNVQVVLHLDPDRDRDPFSQQPMVRVLRGDNGQEPRSEILPMQWRTPDELVMNLPMNGVDTVLPTLDLGDGVLKNLAPARLPYSPEFEPPGLSKGLNSLREIARISQGTSRAQLDQIWGDLPKREVITPLAPWLLPLAAILFLMEILERRTALLSGLWRAGKPGKKVRKQMQTSNKTEPSGQGRMVSPEDVPSTGKVKEEAPQQPTDLFGALDRAKQRAKNRTGGNS